MLSALSVRPPAGDEFDGDCRLMRQPQVVDLFHQRFEELWAAVDPWNGERNVLAERVLRMLAAGLQDEQIAAQLGITPRAVRRHVAKAMADAGAETRFQLGVLYADRYRARSHPGNSGVRHP
ncbi:hypothetical protein GCM10022286_24310 [Gryllotalpicola daejeonensis]|uniref:HTH luxR-type domain-containing protein n=1 Tax=Gryllotalpicola daejeonensis TaxID=993087 RepID=A0ABP7ZLV2_9MICO